MNELAAGISSRASIESGLPVPKRHVLLLALCFALAGCQSWPGQSRARPQDVAAIRQVVASFRESLINKDKATYMGLFFSDRPEDIGWQFVSEDTRLAHIRKSRPDAIKARRIPSNNFIGLIDGAVATKEPREETFSDLRIDTDGEIASVSFDYTFLANGRKTNWAGKCGSSCAPRKAGRSFPSSTPFAISGRTAMANSGSRPGLLFCGVARSGHKVFRAVRCGMIGKASGATWRRTRAVPEA